LLIDVYQEKSPIAPLPKVIHMFYQGMFAAITPALIVGAAAERMRFLPCMVFIFFWSTFVYDFIAYWTWGPDGFLLKLGVLDFAGGTPVHIASGASALAYAILVGTRTGFGTEEFKPHSLSHVVLGTAMLWFGWFGFNG
jgi:Amt family ammonium transporter